MAPTKIVPEKNESKKRAAGLDMDKSTEGLSRGTSSGIDGDSEAESRENSSSPPLRSVALAVDATPYVSFGEGADPVFKNVAIATHKYVYGLNSYKLLGRLYDLPEENEYVPRNFRYSPPTPSHDPDATPEYLPADFPRLTSEEIIENERMAKRAEKSREILYRYRVALVPSIERGSLEDQNPTQLLEKRNSPRVSLTPPHSQPKGSLHKTRSSRIENNNGYNRNVTAGGNLSRRAVLIENPSPDGRPKRSRRGLNAADGPGKLAAQAPLKSNKAQKQLSKASREPLQAQRLPKVRQEPLRASRRLAGKQPEFDMLPYEGTAQQKSEAPRRRNTNNVDLRSPPPLSRLPRDKKKGPSKAAKPQGIVKPETNSTSRAMRQRKLSGS